MSNNRQKLELTWIGKNNPEYDIANIEPRILEERKDLSYGDPNTENMIVHGDNLLVLKALLPEYEGQIKCIYIDPPYNTGNAFEYYDDSVEHSTWLSLMKPRLELLRMLLREDGVIFVQIDDNEQAYLRVLLDDVFDRKNFINTIIVKMKNIAGASGGGEDKRLKKNVEFIHVYSKNYSEVKPFKSVYELTELFDLVEQYGRNNISWKYTSVLFSQGDKEYITSTIDGEGNEIKIFKRINPIFKSISRIIKEEGISEKEAYYKYSKRIFSTAMPQSSIRVRVLETVKNLSNKMGDINNLFSIEYIPRSGKNKGKVYEQFYKGEKLRLLTWLNDVLIDNSGVLYKKDLQGTYWDGLNLNNLTKEGSVEFPNGKKPEALIEKVVTMSTDRNDYILDSFLGSGTTTAVAHKMGRKYIGIEMGNHAYTHVHKRMKSVVDGSDQGGISKAVNWKGGGGFKFYELAPSFIAIDEFGNPVIDSYYNDTKLIQAMCKLMNYTFSPSPSDYWKQGKGQGNNSIYVTTQMLSVAMVQQIASHLKENEILLICPKKYEPGCEKVDTRITIKKIPQSVLKACQFGKKEYLLPIKERPIEETDEDELDNGEQDG